MDDIKLNAPEKAFLIELAELMKRHEVSLFGSDEYDGADNFCGREFVFSNVKTAGSSIYLTMDKVERSLS